MHFWMHPAGKQVMHGGIFLEQALVATPPKARLPASKWKKMALIVFVQ